MTRTRFMIGCWTRVSEEAPWRLAMASATDPPLALEDIDPGNWLDDPNHEIRIQRMTVTDEDATT